MSAQRPPSAFVYVVLHPHTYRNAQWVRVLCDHTHTSHESANTCASEMDRRSGGLERAQVFSVKRSKLTDMHKLAAAKKRHAKCGDTFVPIASGSVILKTTSLRRCVRFRETLARLGIQENGGRVCGDVIELEFWPGTGGRALFKGGTTRDAYGVAARSFVTGLYSNLRDCRTRDGHDPYNA